MLHGGWSQSALLGAAGTEEEDVVSGEGEGADEVIEVLEHGIEESRDDQPYVPPEPVLKGLERSCLLVEVGGGQFEWRHVCVRLQAYVR